MRRLSPRSIAAIAGGLLSAAWPSGCTARADGLADAIAMTHVAVVDVAAGVTRSDQTLVITGNRITALGPSSTVAAPPGARVIDATGAYVIPGLWDLHTHVTMSGRASLALFLANGVTAVRDMGAVYFAQAKGWRDSIAAGTLLGPRMRIASPIVENPRWLAFARDAMQKAGASTEWSVERFGPSSVEEAVRWVDSIAPLGPDHIKVRNWPAPEISAALIAQARKHGLDVVGHANRPFPARGVASIEHSISPPLEDAAARDSLMRGWAAQGTVYVPTLVTWAERSVPLDTLIAMIDPARNPMYRYIPAAQVAEWRKEYASRKYETPTDWTAVIAADERNIKEIRRAGVTILAGTDPATATVIPGFSVHDELEALVHLADMTPAEALRAATLGPARFLRVADSLGTVERGKVADLVLLDADPLTDVRNSKRIRAVVANGRFLDRAEIDRMLAEVERAAKEPAAK
jgi:hypothetical protein